MAASAKAWNHTIADIASNLSDRIAEAVTHGYPDLETRGRPFEMRLHPKELVYAESAPWFRLRR